MMEYKIANRDPKEEMLRTFRLFTGRKDEKEFPDPGFIGFDELKKVAKDLGERMTDEELKGMIELADKDNDGKVGPNEFMKIMKKV